MGIKGIKQVIKKHAPDAITELDISQLKNKKVAIDSSIFLYRFRYSFSGDNFHILGFLYKIIELLQANIIPVFVFDGKPPDAKKETLAKRSDTRAKSKERLSELNGQKSKLIEEVDWNQESIDEFIDSGSDSEAVDQEKLDRKKKIKEIKKLDQEISKIEKNTLYVGKNHSLEVIELLKFIGIPFFEAPGEAEESCAFLQKTGQVDYILTEDTDSLTFGSKSVLFLTKDKNTFNLCTLAKVLEQMEITFESFVDLCILCGCDYTCTIPKVGPVTAYTGIKKYTTIEEFITNNTKYQVPESFEYQLARDLFKQNNEYTGSFDFRCGQKNLEGLHSFLTQHSVLDPQFFINKLKRNN